jgi:hypothetical protein
MIILRIALTLTEYEVVLKDLIKSGQLGGKGDSVEQWAAREIFHQIDRIRKGEYHESDRSGDGKI